ncbi:MAG: ABC transporter ATP-binding protein [Rhodobacteraceae bacterium]|nr:ABC transporter ATP-binding protein [Paracoccaceae bacterium]
MTALLSIGGVTKRFGRVTAIDRLSLDIHENEFFALLGASGSGKTTLLRMLAGFETPEAGAILLDGKDISRMPPNRRPVNLMFQSYALFPHMSVEGNIAYGLEMERLPKAEIARRVGEIMAITELSTMAKRKPDQLSGGQKQRVALARALVKRPRLLLLDEPLGALDKKLRSAMQLELKRLQHEVGITFIVVTHDQEEALVMADRVAILRDGRLLQCGTPHEVYEHPANRFAADFIGVMNFIEEDGRTLALRPERIRLFPERADRTTEGRVTARAYHGLDLQLHVETPLSPRPLLVRLTADAADRRPVAEGDTVTLGWNDADTRIFKD